MSIFENLRPIDKFEFECAGLHWPYTEVVSMVTDKDAFVISYDLEPVFAFGAMRAGHTAHLWGFGTERATRVIPAVTRLVKNWWLPHLFENDGVKRIEVRVPLKSQHSISWLRKFGMTVEAWDLQDNFVNGEPGVQLAYTTREYTLNYVHLRQEQGRVGPGPDASPDENER